MKAEYDVVLGFGNTVAMNVYQSHGGVHQCSTMRKLRAVRNPAMRLLKSLFAFLSPKYFACAWIESAPFRINPRPALIAISEMVRQDLSRHFRVPEQDIRLVYNGIDFGRFSAIPPSTATNLRSRLGFDREVLFLFMAYDFRKKGVRYLVEAAGELSRRVGPGKFGVVVVGRTPPLPLQRLVRKLHLDDTVVFLGLPVSPRPITIAATSLCSRRFTTRAHWSCSRQWPLVSPLLPRFSTEQQESSVMGAMG